MTEEPVPLVSIVIPSYRGMPFLPTTVASALAQDYPNLEVIVVENASGDGSAEWLQSQTDPRLRVVYREETQSAADNWTQAVNESIGDYVKLLCADDVVEPWTVSTQVAQVLTHPGAVMAASRRRIIDADGNVLREPHGLGRLRGLVDGRSAVRACLVTGANVLGEPGAILLDGPLLRSLMPWRSTWPYVIDLATYAEVLHHGSVYCDRQVLASFRVSGTSWSSDLIGEHYEQFHDWRDAVAESDFVPLSAWDRMRGDVGLRLRTVARQLYFSREARRARRRR